ncbi:nucleoside phosphorylase domain-containing protein [Aspergillus egyptiacus]|nr:nucleoside phosphorylase domain-containing protein [Aspergillus egyptiacus]
MEVPVEASLNSYNVAIICTEPLIRTVLSAALDNVQPSRQHFRESPHHYSYGQISGHNVVLVRPKVGCPLIMSHILATCPNVRFALIVGIGSGIPGREAEIRLGDIVVSKPTEQGTVGIIQYQYQGAETKGILAKENHSQELPRDLRDAIREMENRPASQTRQLKQIMQAAVSEHDLMRRLLARHRNDWLFETTCTHGNDHSNCFRCKLSMLDPRRLRQVSTDEPRVHYGRIATADPAIVSALHQEGIAREDGVICLDTEPVSLTDDIPYLLIRGISDYGGSDKNTEWHGYAALASAAYAKLLLSAVPPVETVSEKKSV